VLGIDNGEIVKVTALTIPNTSVLISISFCTLSSVTFTISLLTIPIVNGEIVKVTDDSVQREIDINTEVLGIDTSVLISISFCTFLFVTFTISPLTIPNTSLLISISFCTKVTGENVQKEIDINTEVFGIVNGEIIKVTDDNVQKEIDMNTEVLGIVNFHH
jgi:hypothetical protein